MSLARSKRLQIIYLMLTLIGLLALVALLANGQL